MEAYGKQIDILVFASLVLSKNNTQCESCELSFIWGKVRTTAQEKFLRGIGSQNSEDHLSR